MPYVRIVNSNPFKMVLLSSGAGFTLAGALQLALIGPLTWPVACTSLGVLFMTVSLLLRGNWFTHIERVKTP